MINYQQYIWQFQFHPGHFLRKEIPYFVTIDYINRKLTINRIDPISSESKSQCFDISDDEFEGLLQYSEIEKIREFENKSEEELSVLEEGYRDGWYVEYSYYTQDVPPRTDGALHTLHKENPLEKLVNWAMVYVLET